MKKNILTALTSAALLASTVWGQQPQQTVSAQPSPQKKSPKRADEGGGTGGNSASSGRQQIALQTLQFLKSSGGEIEDVKQRIRVQLEVADAMWLADPEQSRDVFRRAMEQAAAYEESLDEKTRKLAHTSLRQSVVSRAARRDPAFANTLLNAFAPKANEPTADDAFAKLYGRDELRANELVKAALDILPADASQAAQVATLAASDGFSQGLRQFLLDLRAKDPAAADALYEVAFRSAANRRPKELVEALFLWDYAFQHGSIYLGPVSWLGEDGWKPAPVSVDVKKRALTFAVQAVVENVQQFNLAAASEEERPLIRERYVLVHSLASQIMPDVAKHLPSALPILQTHLTRIDQALREAGRTPPAPPEPMPSGAGANDDVEKMLDIAGRVTNPQVRDGVYARAALSLYLRDDYERALEVAGKIEGSELRLEMTEPIRFDRAGALIERGELDVAAEVARAIEKPETRAIVLARLGSAYFAAKKPGPALEVLSDAEQAAAKAKPSAALASTVLGIARSYAEHDRLRALEVAAGAIRTINALEGDLPWELLQAGKVERLKAQSHHWTTGRGGVITNFSVAYPQIGGLLDVLSKVSDSDLDGSLTIARELKSKSLSYGAQAILCRQALERALRAPNKGGTGKGKLRTE